MVFVSSQIAGLMNSNKGTQSKYDEKQFRPFTDRKLGDSNSVSSQKEKLNANGEKGDVVYEAEVIGEGDTTSRKMRSRDISGQAYLKLIFW